MFLENKLFHGRDFSDLLSISKRTKQMIRKMGTKFKNFHFFFQDFILSEMRLFVYDDESSFCAPSSEAWRFPFGVMTSASISKNLNFQDTARFPISTSDFFPGEKEQIKIVAQFYNSGAFFSRK